MSRKEYGSKREIDWTCVVLGIFGLSFLGFLMFIVGELTFYHRIVEVQGTVLDASYLPASTIVSQGGTFVDGKYHPTSTTSSRAAQWTTVVKTNAGIIQAETEPEKFYSLHKGDSVVALRFVGCLSGTVYSDDIKN